MNYRVTRHIGPRWNFIERCYNEREQHVYYSHTVRKKSKAKKHASTNTMALIDHFMELKEENRD